MSLTLILALYSTTVLMQVGILEIVRCDVEVQPSFVDYLRGGCEV